jgi:DNA gyrase subunit A
MSKKKKSVQKEYVYCEPIPRSITQTLETNYMPYAMSVIMSRAIPEIDGLKPAHRKLLYTMYGMGLLRGRQKSANIVGATMKLNPHGDGAIYETMVRLTRGYEAMPHPFINSKGNFGKYYSRDMAYAASRYTEAGLAPICRELFDDIDKQTVDFVPNYDNSTTEPSLLPVTFPTILTTPNQGIAVGMASNICSFNLGEVCDTVIEYLKNPDHSFALTMPAPDFSTGGRILMNKSDIEQIYETGRGSVRIRAKYGIDEKSGSIIVTEIPYTTTIEAIIDKIVDLVKAGKLKEIADVKDMSDLSGLKIRIELKRGTDADKTMARLYKMTPLEDSFGCNFNILVGGVPRVMSVREIIDEWLAFRTECIKRRTYFSLGKAREKLHLLQGLQTILLDIDKAVKIVRETEHDDEVVPNLMIGFGIDEVQAEYIANIRLRHLNREYILKRVEEIEALNTEISQLEGVLADRKKQHKIIIEDLKRIKKQYPSERKSELVYDVEDIAEDIEEHVEDYAVTLFLSEQGYFKKITPQSLRMNSTQSFKDGDRLCQSFESSNAQELIFFTNMHCAYKTRVNEFDDTKASALGEYVPAKLSMEQDEAVVAMAATSDYSGYMVFFFENGRAAKVPVSAYRTQTNRKRLVGAYCDKFPLVRAVFIKEDCEFLLTASNNKALIVNTALIPVKTTKSTQGVIVFTQKGKNTLTDVKAAEESGIKNTDYYRTKAIPAVGHFLRDSDMEQPLQQNLFD